MATTPRFTAFHSYLAPVEATDIRAGAGLVLAALVSEGETTVDGAFHVDRGYPNFAEQLRALGADVVRE